MEKPLKCFAFAPPSLLDISLRRVVILLWSDPDVLDTISKFPYHKLQFEKTREEWQKTTEDKIKLKIWKLLPELPENLPPMMIPIVPHISSEIEKWAVFHIRLAYVRDILVTLPYLTKLCWTAEGAIDYRKTATEFVRSRELNIMQRYVIASHYCLEDDIPLLWGELSAEEKGNFSDSSPSLPFCWPAILEGEEPYICNSWLGNRTSYNQFAFENELEFGTKAAAEYFFRKLTNEERGDSLVKYALSVLTKLEFNKVSRLRDILFYLLSIMTPEQQLKIIKENPVEVWICFLVWPRQHLFLENAGLFWTFIDKSRYDQLLMQFGGRCKDYYFPKLFAGFLKLSPQEFKKYFLPYNSFYFTSPCRFLSIFFRYEDAEAITEMFSSVDRADRVKLVFNNSVFDLFFENMRKQVRWDMVKLCLQEAALSEKDRKRLRNAFARFLARKKVSEECLDNFKKIFKFLGEPDN